MSLRFEKLCAAGNDFVLVENPPRRLCWKALAPKICDRRRGIGADGLLLLRTGPGRPRLDYLNADGSAAFCGNGARAAAWWLFRRAPAAQRELSIAGSHDAILARRDGAGASVRLPDPRRLRLNLRLKALGKTVAAHLVDTGVPHLVVEVPDPAAVDVSRLGPALRRHRVLGPRGANVNFVRFLPRAAEMRTYERGVEAETLACGTGAAAVAAVGRALGRAQSPLRVLTAGRQALTVRFRDDGPGRLVREVWVAGPASSSFRGELDL